MKKKFIPLRIFTPFSLAQGTVRIPKLIDFLKKENITAAAISDINYLGASLQFAQSCVKNTIKPIIGTTVFIHYGKDDPRLKKIKTSENNFDCVDQICLYSQNSKGFENLNLLSSIYWKNRQKANSSTGFLYIEDIEKHNEGLIALSGGVNADIANLFLQGEKDYAKTLLSKYKKIFDNNRYYIEITRQGTLNEKLIENFIALMSHEFKLPLVATNPSFFIEPVMFEAHDVLTCIREGNTRVNEKNRVHSNKNYYLKTENEMNELFSDIPEAIENSWHIAMRCSFWPEEKKPSLPSFKSELTQEEEIKKQAHNGLENRIKNYIIPNLKEQNKNSEEIKLELDDYYKRLNYELNVINTMGYNGYFLIVSDFIKWAKKNEIPVGPGRGSGAGSLAAWVLDITNIDPIRFGLIFERFLNPERISMPDFDIDFCQDRRDEVIEYVCNKYGKENVAQIITFGKMLSKMALRDVGRVLGMSYFEVDRICSLVPYNPANPISLKEALTLEPKFLDLYENDEIIKNLIDISIDLEGLYRHSSIHAAGIVIGDKPLKQIIPLYYDLKNPIAITQYNMKDVEKVGLVKFDFLGLKTLSVIKQAVEMIKNKGIKIDIDNIRLDCDKAFKIIVDKLTVGIFQIEGSGMTEVASKMLVNSIEDITALISLYRPGPLDNIPLYIDRKLGRKKIEMMDESLRPILNVTFGIPVYQEQIIKIAQVFAGYSASKADLLRRAMGKKIPEIMIAEKKNFVNGAIKNGHCEKLAEKVFAQVDKFSGYGFNKSHAAAYAMISYQTAFLKAHHPTEFMAATMNYMIDNTDKLALTIFELKRMDIKLLPPDINNSYGLFTPEYDEITGKSQIRYGLYALKNIGHNFVDQIIATRNKSGNFNTLWEFFSKVPAKNCNSRQLEHLVKAGVFDTLNQNRKQIFLSLEKLKKEMPIENKLQINPRQHNLLDILGVDSNTQKKDLVDVSQDWANLKKLDYELEAIGLYISSHPLEKFNFLLDSSVTSLADLNKSVNIDEGKSFSNRKIEKKIVAVLLSKQIKVSKTSNKRYAFLRISDTSGVKEINIFSKPLAEFENLLEEGSLLEIIAKPLFRSNQNEIDTEITWSIEKINDLSKSIDLSITNKEFIFSYTKGSIIDITKDIKLLKENLRPGAIDLKINHKTKEKNLYISLGKYSFHSITKICDDMNCLTN